MADTAINIPEFVTVIDRDRPLGKLALIMCDLLNGEAEHLPAPQHAEAWSHSQEIELGFSGEQATFTAMAAWAERFGATITAQRSADRAGQPYVRCALNFIYQGVTVKAHAYIEAAKAAS
jgi:hypothetical protein